MFRHTEDFNAVIERATGHAPLRLDLIPTGWTNIVFEAEMPDECCFFRFPRDDFWAWVIEKDFNFVEYIRPRVSFTVPGMRLFRDDGRAFSMHRKIEGRSLQSALPTLDAAAAIRAAEGIADVLIELAALDPSACRGGCDERLSEFLKKLAATHFDRLDERYYERLLNSETRSLGIVHGDLNPGNIIVGDKGEVRGVIDFGFAGIGNRMSDVSRIVGRSPAAFGTVFLGALGRRYFEVDSAEVDGLVETWNYVEREYIGFMKRHHPEITLPPGV
ncbi:MAG: aminoglycoside phosphotransferase family protein [Rickettsiales bacterium]|jgi:aminoglycoside phosphotransferase (APT) family kinase protein|nr:aminoglycoside phosphotransferase family protein [Rickettsiales bacterium]